MVEKVTACRVPLRADSLAQVQKNRTHSSVKGRNVHTVLLLVPKVMYVLRADSLAQVQR